jgi:hypothetical protein
MAHALPAQLDKPHLEAKPNAQPATLDAQTVPHPTEHKSAPTAKTNMDL